MYSIKENLIVTSSDRFYFSCPSYGFIGIILSLIDEIRPENPEINILVMDDQVRSFWEQLIRKNELDWELIYINTKPPGSLKNVFSWFKIRPYIRKLFKDNFMSIKGAHFYICGHSTNLVFLALVKLIIQNNSVVFLNIFYADTKINISIKSFILFIHAWLVYRLHVSVRSFDFRDAPNVFLSEKYFKKYNTILHEFKYHFNADILQKYNPIPERYTFGKKIIWLGDDCLLYDKEKADSVAECFNSIKKIIDKKFTREEILYKPHPNPMFNSKDIAWVYKDYDELPPSMNADFLISNPDIKFIIGGVSAVLSTAAKNTEVIAISYHKLMPFADQKIGNNMLDFFIKEGEQRIKFINSLEELESLIRN